MVATNKARRARLAEITKDRLAYQEYCELRDSIDRNINNLYAKLQKKDRPKVVKKKKKGDAGGDNVQAATNGMGIPLPNPATMGLILEEDGTLSAPEALKSLVETRRKWVDTLGEAFAEKQREFPGRIWGTPQKSVFEGIDEEVRLALQAVRVSSPARKRKESRTDMVPGKDGIYDFTMS